MIKVEKLSNDNMKEFTDLLKEAKSKNEFIRDFFKYYDGKSFIYRYIVRKMVYLISFNDKFIGYIWLESPSLESTKVSDIFIKEEYIKYFTGKLLLILKTEIATLECYENDYSMTLLKALDMTRVRMTYLMKLEEYKKSSDCIKDNIDFRIYKNKKDAKIRCDLQNKIFYDNSRVPLTLEDIYYDEKQEYYLKDLSLFILLNGVEIGYGQIIYSRNMYLIVNFGILKDYRGHGYGKLLLKKLINLTKEKEIEDLYIRVDYNNRAAYGLYSSIGFKILGNFSTWMWTKN